MVKTPKVAVFAGDIDSIVLGLSSPLPVYFLAAHQSVVLRWISQFIPSSRILTYHPQPKCGYLNNCNIALQVKYSDITSVLKQNQVTHLLPFKIKPSLYRWSLQNHISLVSTDYSRQSRLENKIYFDRLLAKHHLPKPPSFIFHRRLNNPPFSTPYVLQKPNSWSGEGTFFIDHPDQIDQLIQNRKINPRLRYLIRQKITGTSYGISVFICPGTIALSRCRRQCFLPEDSSGVKKFAGLQWETEQFSSKTVDQINQSFLKIGQLLYQQQYFGFANFDFIVQNDGSISIIECNPRLSSATFHIFQFPSLISDLNLKSLFFDGFFQTKNYRQPARVYSYPSSSFTGSVFHVFTPSSTLSTIKSTMPLGLYSADLNTPPIADITRFSIQSQQFVNFSEVEVGEKYPDSDFTYLYSNFPLFGQNNQPNSTGQKLSRYFCRQQL